MKASVYIATSLDGFIARKDGSLDWLPGAPSGNENDTEDYGHTEFMDSVDALVMGRNTFETVADFGEWPYGEKPVLVLSSRRITTLDHVPDTVEFFAGSPNEVVRHLSDKGARHLYIDGGKTIQGFLAAGLIQQIIVSTIPVLIGEGIPLFGALTADVQLRLVKTKGYANGLVQSHYEIIHH